MKKQLSAVNLNEIIEYNKCKCRRVIIEDNPEYGLVEALTEEKQNALFGGFWEPHCTSGPIAKAISTKHKSRGCGYYYFIPLMVNVTVISEEIINYKDETYLFPPIEQL